MVSYFLSLYYTKYIFVLIRIYDVTTYIELFKLTITQKGENKWK